MYGPQSDPRQPSYAPIHPHGLSSHSFAARINLDEEVKLADSAAERDLVDSLAEVYSIIRTLDGLEKAFQKDALPENEYTDMCSKMIKQYQSILSDSNVDREFRGLDAFMREWDASRSQAANLQASR